MAMSITFGLYVQLKQRVAVGARRAGEGVEC